MAYTISDLEDDATTLSAVEFRQRHGNGFLIVFGRSEGGKPESKRPSTQLAKRTTSTMDVRIHPLSSGFKWIDCGRTPNNDVVVEDSTVSKLHAWFRRDGDTFLIWDAGSRNGTRVGDQPAPRRGSGDGVRLVENVSVELGSVRARFVHAATLQQLVCTVVQRPAPS